MPFRRVFSFPGLARIADRPNERAFKGSGSPGGTTEVMRRGLRPRGADGGTGRLDDRARRHRGDHARRAARPPRPLNRQPDGSLFMPFAAVRECARSKTTPPFRASPRYARMAVRPQTGSEDRMAGFLFRLETPDGAPAEPSTLASAVPSWKAGDTVPLGGRTLRVVDVRDDEADQPPVLVVEDT